MTARHKAGTARYPGVHVGMVGEVKGPTTYGGVVVAESAEYDPETHRTTVTFAHVRVSEYDRITRDEFGQRRLDGAA